MNVSHVIVGYGGTALAVICGALAAWRGGWPERSAAIVVLMGWFLTPLIQTTYAPGLPLMALDSAQAVILFAISRFSRRIWSVVITACMSVSFISHVAEAAAPGDHKTLWSYATAADLLGGVLVALCLGAAAWESEFLRKRIGKPSATST